MIHTRFPTAATAVFLCLLAPLAMGGCALLPPGTGGDDDGDGLSVATLRAFKLEDLKTAQALAEAAGDRIAAPCWKALAEAQAEKIAAAAPTASPEAPQTVGAFALFQKARNLRRRLAGGLGDELKLACGPLLVEEQRLLLRLARLVGVPVPAAP